MKKINLIVMLCIVAFAASAQYKKASFLTRNGKFYGIKTGLNVYSKGVSAAPVIAFVYGKDKGKNRIWHWWDLEFALRSKYNYTTQNNNNTSQILTVSGTTNTMLSWRYNWCYYFADNSNDDIKGLPFAKIAIELGINPRFVRGESEKITPIGGSNSPLKSTDVSGVMGIDIGGGYTYKVSEKATVFGVAGYRYMPNAGEESTTYNLSPNHPYINIGIRFAKKSDD
jgi:hypothetical protein